MTENSILLGTSPVKIITAVDQFNTATIEAAKQTFRELIERGVIKGGSFEDDVWYTTDEYSNISLNFDFNEFTYRIWFEDIFDTNIVVFTEYVKVYILYLFGKIVLISMQGLLADLRRILKTPPEELYGLNADLTITHTHLLAEFLSLFPGSDENERINELLSALDEYAYIQQKLTGNARQLAQFDSYFLFHDIICDFWKNCKDEETKLFYYPLYLWWQLTTVIPTRPKEFVLTQRNCLEHRDDGYYLTLQKDCLKGKSKAVGYKVSVDYRPVTYKIPDELGICIEHYIHETEKYDPTKLGTLFIADTHYRKWKKKKNKKSRYLTYVNMRTILRYFYTEIIEGVYGLKVIYGHSNSHLEKGTIEYINLGDARHLALINLMQQGGTPMLAMFLAGHDNETMSCHYWSNIRTMIECQTYRQYRLVTGSKINYQVSRTQLVQRSIQNGSPLQDGCKCFSYAYQSGDVSDCRAAIGPEGEIGYCPSCTYHRKNNSNYWRSASVYERRIEDCCRELEEAVNLVRKGKGNGEEIGEALLRLKDVSASYAKYLEEVKNAEDSEHGPKENY